MSFLSWAALAIAALVIAPVAAHLLRRRPPREQPFAAVALVPVSPAVTRRRTALEDRALFGLRTLSVLALALLGATPFITCSRLSIARRSGASVALAVVLDDSLSMRAAMPDEPGTSRFARARQAAEELVAGLEPGDAVALVLAGSPPRVALAATTNLRSAAAALAAVEPSDRATDLEGALLMAQEMLRDLSHIDKRVVLLSDRADGRPDDRPLDVAAGLALWAPLEELVGDALDCALRRADRLGARVTVEVVCGPGSPPERRRVALRAAGSEEPLVTGEVALPGGRGEVALALPPEAELEGVALRAVLEERDAVAEDDVAPVASAPAELGVAILDDAAESRVATGGAPPVEQAFAALEAGVHVQPLSAAPERASELAPYGILVADDVPGFTPESRRELAGWVERGGVLLLALGPQAAAAPLGAGFAPMLPALVRYRPTKSKGVGRDDTELFGPHAQSLADLRAEARVELDLGDTGDGEAPEVLVTWDDGAPLLLRHRMVRGSVFILTLPLGTAHSDLALRPGFLALLQHLVDTARSLGGVGRTEVGATWSFDGVRELVVTQAEVVPAAAPLAVTGEPPRLRVTPPRIGRYLLWLDGQRAERLAAPARSEADLRPRKLAREAGHSDLGGGEATIDISSYIALGLLALLAGELGLRALSQRERARARAPRATT
ncbi:MAG: VWA domain-containing protein [Polyangiaceae bacterium]|nr:VWA domain-containing protein [Polyangiaceae bacterium]